jgi:hypothetical protein
MHNTADPKLTIVTSCVGKYNGLPNYRMTAITTLQNEKTCVINSGLGTNFNFKLVYKITPKDQQNKIIDASSMLMKLTKCL